MRASGVLLPISSLPGGRLGPEAYRFVDWLKEAGQKWWQVLPVGPPGPHGAPYSALSSFAGNEAFVAPSDKVPDAAFSRRHKDWLKDYARFRALRDELGGPWTSWPRILPDVESLPYRIAQYAFEREWTKLRSYANRRGIGLIGDLPFFVALDSADVWANPELFRIDKRGRPTVLTGVPPDYFSKSGQLWNHPHYDWAAHKKTRFAWWRARAKRAFELFDMVRIDHFLAFARAWEVSPKAKTAKRGKWVPGPGRALLKAVAQGPLIAEDLGVANPEAEALRREFFLPGMRVLQFCFGADPANRPYTIPRRCVVYTGTHDNDTVRGWSRTPDAKRARAYAGGGVKDFPWAMVRLALTSAADLSIVPVQDLLGLGSKARLNKPGTVKGNWTWRLRRGQLTKTLARRLRELTEAADR